MRLRVLRIRPDDPKPSALILVPTRELASQVAEAGKALERALVSPRNRSERVLAFAARL